MEKVDGRYIAGLGIVMVSLDAVSYFGTGLTWDFVIIVLGFFMLCLCVDSLLRDHYAVWSAVALCVWLLIILYLVVRFLYFETAIL